MQINLTFTDPRVSKIIRDTITNIMTMNPEVEIEYELVTDVHVAKARGPKQRVFYRAIDPANAPEAMKGIGAHTIKGIIFSDILKATVDGTQLTAKKLMATRRYPSGTILGSIQELRLGGLVESCPIVADELEVN